MNKIVVTIVGVVIAILAVGGYLLINKNKDSEKSSSNSNNQTSQSQNTNSNQSSSEEESTEGSLETFRSAGKARSCTLAYSDTAGSGKGTMYTDGKGRGRIMLDLVTERGNTGQSNTLVLAEKTYAWTKTDSGSFGTVFDTKTIQPNSSGSPTTSNTQTAGKNFSLKCKDWTVDESMLIVPSDVTFTALPSTP